MSKVSDVQKGALVVLLCDESVFRTAPMFDTRRRIERAGLRIIETRPCGSEIIKVIKEGQRKAS